MTISIQFVKMPTSEALSDYTEKRLEKLASKYNWLISAAVSFKQGSDAIKSKVCEIELSLPGPKIFASSKEENYETAVNNTISDLNRQLRKRKETTFNH